MSNNPNAVGATVGNDELEISDDECLVRLAEVVQHHDAAPSEAAPLDEVAWLIGRLAVAIE
jgi:hypothetical protein